MGDRGTRDPLVDFPYLEEMDTFLRRKHSIEPQSIASSTRENTSKWHSKIYLLDIEVKLCIIVPDNVQDLDSEDCDGVPAKIAKLWKTESKITAKDKTNQKAYDAILSELKSSNKVRERRHQEALDARNRAIDVVGN